MLVILHINTQLHYLQTNSLFFILFYFISKCNRKSFFYLHNFLLGFKCTLLFDACLSQTLALFIRFPLALPSSLQTTSFSFQLQAVVCTQFLSLSLSVRYRVAASELSSTERWHSLFWSSSSPLSFPILCSSWKSETVHKVKLYVHSIYVVVVSKLFPLFFKLSGGFGSFHRSYGVLIDRVPWKTSKKPLLSIYILFFNSFHIV